MSAYRLVLALAAVFAVTAAAAQVAASVPNDTQDSLSTVIVTGEKSGRSLLDTATSVSVLSSRDLERRAGLNTTRDLLEYTPNISLVGTGNQAPTIRGVDGTGAAKGADAFYAGSRPRLNVQIDGRPASYNEITFGDSALWDVDHVEILRGAQSTLQGRNAIAGTLITKTKDPTFDFENTLRVAFGNFEHRRYSGMVSGPVMDDSVAFRIAADYLTKHTFVDGYEGFPTVKDPGDFSALNVRGKLLVQPSSIEGLRSLITVNHSDYSGPQTEEVFPPFNALHTDFPHEPVFEPKTTSLIADTSYIINPRLTLESILSGTDLGVKRKSDPGEGIVNIDGHEYLFEPRLRFRGESREGGVAGVYLYRSQQDESIDFPAPQAFDDRVTTAAVFTEGTWPMTVTLDLIVGARYEQEKHERHGGDQTLVRIDLDETYRAFLPKVGLAWHAQANTTVGVMVLRGYNGGGAGFTFDERSGIFTNYQYDPEYVTTGEVYARHQALDGRLNLTANVFYSDYQDMQLSYDLTPADPTDYSFVVRNADRAKSYGAEFGADWTIGSGVGVYGSLGLLHAKITKYPGSGFQGNDQPIAPAATAAGGLTWHHPSGIEASVSGRYSASYYSDLENQPRGHVGPYFVANGQAGYRFAHVRIYGSVENLFDSDKLTAVYSGATPPEDAADILPPRSYWLGVEVSL
ncbi:MAG TPA: TonB-dependent receptor [Steroidobacteraceae bacterium]|nr:TonB-dependent receptor [Steroidobacteraceae bacterium]